MSAPHEKADPGQLFVCERADVVEHLGQDRHSNAALKDGHYLASEFQQRILPDTNGKLFTKTLPKIKKTPSLLVGKTCR